jgi:zinc transport system substrate-binding protein
MIRHVAYAASFALVLLVAQVPQAETRREVLVTAEVLQPLLADLMQGVGTVSSLTPRGGEAHMTGLTVRQSRALRGAKVIVSPDPNLAPGLKKPLMARAREGAVVIYLTQLSAADPLPYRRKNPFLALETLSGGHDMHDHGHDHAHAQEINAEHQEKKGKTATEPAPKMMDPHLWLDPLRMAALLPELAETLAQIWPEAAPTLHANAEKMAQHLITEVHPGITHLLDQARARNRDDSTAIPFMTYHDAYHYFQRRYDLTMGFITQRPEEYLGARTMQQLLTQAKVSQVRCLITERKTAPVERLADLSQAKIMLLNSDRSYSAQEVPLTPWAKNDYDRLLLAVAKTFAECL